MKILYIDLKYDYGMPHRGVNEIGLYGIGESLTKIGHDVHFFYYDQWLHGDKKALQIELLAEAEKINPDLIFFALISDQFEFTTLDKLKSKYKTLNWFGDDQWRFENFTSKYAPYFTWCITTDSFALPKYKKLGIKNVILSQWAAIDRYKRYPSETYDYDVSFVGGSNSTRRWFIREFEKRGIKVATFGFGWPSGPVTMEKLATIFQRSKINLNLSNSTTLDIRYLLDNFKNPIVAYKSPKSASQIKARNFEIPYYGGFQITDYTPTIENYFSIGREIICYRDVDEAAVLTKFYLENEDLRKKICDEGVTRSHKEHSYMARFQKIFESLE